MESYLPLIKSTLSDWYLFTLDNALYATVLAVAVWLLSAILYNIKIAGLKRAKIAAEKTANESLNVMQQQLQQSQEHLVATVEEKEQAQSAIDKETQRALALEQLIYQRNQQVANTIQTLASSFDLGERPLLASEDVKAEPLWQQHDKVITQLIERLRTESKAKIELQQACQLETAKLAEKETLLKLLQATLDTHTHQLSNLEQALQEQKNLLLEQRIADTAVRTHQPEAPQSADIEPPAQAWQQPVQHEDTPVIEAPSVAQPEQIAELSINPTMAASWLPEQTPIEPVIVAETAEPLFLEISTEAELELESADEDLPLQPFDEQPQPATAAKGSLGKIKNLFGKKQTPVKTEPQWTTEETQTPASEQPTSAAESNPGKMKGFYSKLRSKK